MLSIAESRRTATPPRYSLLRHCRALVSAPGFYTLVAAAGAVAGYSVLR
jgi:hypothetical protein